MNLEDLPEEIKEGCFVKTIKTTPRACAQRAIHQKTLVFFFFVAMKVERTMEEKKHKS